MLAVEKVDEVPFIPLIILFSPLLSLYNKLTPLRLEELLQNKKRPLTLISHFPSQTINFTICQFINVDIAILESFRVTKSDE